MGIKIALAGNPNCGKTTMFNDLTGSAQYVGNWPGVTVEKKEGKLKGHKDIMIVDLPGIYSLSPYTLEEVVTRDYLVNEKPDVIINIVDATNLERNLYLTTQLTEVGIPVVIALNMMDIIKKNGDIINIKRLSEALGCEIIETSALKGMGSKQVAERAIHMAKTGVKTTPQHTFSDAVEGAIKTIEDILPGSVSAEQKRWFSVKLFERDEKAVAKLSVSSSTLEHVEAVVSQIEAELDDDAESIITNERYEYITKVISKTLVRKQKGAMTTSDKIDRIVTNRWLALPIFAAIIWVIYYISVSTVGTIVTDWTNDVLFGEWILEGTAGFLESVGTADWLNSLIVDGIIGGVGTVLGFVPQMFILFFFLSILEDTGYMARVAFIMDRIFRKFGLSGKSFIPILISSGCAVPGIMATRTMENDRDRKMTIMTTSFMPCGAKTVIIAVITTAFFPQSVWIAPSMYFLGLAMIVISGIILKKTKLFSGDPAPFVMELPAYHIPSAKGVLFHMWERGKSFIIKAGTIIFVASALIWFLSSFSWGLEMIENTDESILASIGNAIAPIFAPLGFGTWQGAVASISALAAKENAIGTFGVLLGLGSDAAAEDADLLTGLATMFTTMGGLSFMIFNLFNPPCFAAIGATRREMGTWKWTGIALAYQFGLGYAMSLIVFQLGNFLFMGTPFTVGTGVAIALIVFTLWMLFRPAQTANKAARKAPLSA